MISRVAFWRKVTISQNATGLEPVRSLPEPSLLSPYIAGESSDALRWCNNGWPIILEERGASWPTFRLSPLRRIWKLLSAQPMVAVSGSAQTNDLIFGWWNLRKGASLLLCFLLLSNRWVIDESSMGHWPELLRLCTSLRNDKSSQHFRKSAEAPPSARGTGVKIERSNGSKHFLSNIVVQ